jgi:hypothetical protein
MPQEEDMGQNRQRLGDLLTGERLLLTIEEAFAQPNGGPIERKLDWRATKRSPDRRTSWSDGWS